MISGNYQFKQPPTKNGEEYNCISMQKYPGTVICKGGKDLTFSGNQINCTLPEGSIKTDECNNSQIEYCDNIEANKWMDLEAEPVECDHCTEKIILDVNDKTKNVYKYENKVL